MLTEQKKDFIPSIPIDSSSFALWIHQTFPSFCTDVEQVAEGMDYLCLADVMRTDDDIVSYFTWISVSR